MTAAAGVRERGAFSSRPPALAIAALALLAACGGSSTQPPASPAPGSGGPEAITGRESIGWRQTAADVSGYAFSIYVDGAKNAAPQTSCSPAAAGAFDCRSPLPPLTNGTHTLEITASIIVDGQELESPRSSALTVNVSGANAVAGAFSAAAGPVDAAATARSSETGGNADAAAADRCGLSPWDAERALAWTADGSLAVVGVDGGRTPLDWRQGDDDGWRLAGAARDARFSETRRVYLAFLRVTTEGRLLRIARYREAGGTLGERAVLSEVSLRFLPAAVTLLPEDGRLDAALLGAPGRAAAPHAFLLRGSTSGSGAPFLFGDETADAPSAVATTFDGGLLTLDRDANGTYTLRTDGSRSALPLLARPIAVATNPDGDGRLFVVSDRGAAISTLDAARGWTRFRMFTSVAQPLQDVLLLPGGRSLGCSAVDGSLAVVNGRWRG